MMQVTQIQNKFEIIPQKKKSGQKGIINVLFDGEYVKANSIYEC